MTGTSRTAPPSSTPGSGSAPGIYAWAGSTPETAYVKEMELVRKGVGLADVSTLGKIDIQGPDAAEFLNRVYVNGFAKLPVGKVRYGVMLNDDGIVLDDGTTARISRHAVLHDDDHRAGGRGHVMARISAPVPLDGSQRAGRLAHRRVGAAWPSPAPRRARRCSWPSRMPISRTRACPTWAARTSSFDGVTVRLLRMSFSGELAYEVHVAADYAISLWEHILKAAAPTGIKPYGLEALASLRIEKGHVAGLELDHRNTLDDLGLGKMAGKEKDYVGRALRFREDCQSPERWSLVGLELMEPDKKLRGGAILFAATDEIKGHGRGYITSVTWSTELNKFIALGLYHGGLKHEGEEIIAAFPLKNEQARLEDRLAALHRQGRGAPPCLSAAPHWHAAKPYVSAALIDRRAPRLHPHAGCGARRWLRGEARRRRRSAAGEGGARAGQWRPHHLPHRPRAVLDRRAGDGRSARAASHGAVRGDAARPQPRADRACRVHPARAVLSNADARSTCIRRCSRRASVALTGIHHTPVTVHCTARGCLRYLRDADLRAECLGCRNRRRAQLPLKQPSIDAWLKSPPASCTCQACAAAAMSAFMPVRGSCAGVRETRAGA